MSYKIGEAEASSTVPTGLSLSKAGVLTVDPSNAVFKSLGEGQTQTITVAYTISDGEGSSVAQTATVTITGTNDAPTIGAEVLVAAAVGGEDSVTLNLLQGASDIDKGDTLSVKDVSYKIGEAEASSTVPAGFILSDAGVLTVDPSDAAYNFLGEGQTQTIVVSYTISDGQGDAVAQTATITVNGAAQTVEIKLASALELYKAGTYYSDDDTVTVRVEGSDISAGAGLYSLGLSDLGALGADVIDINGSAEDASLHITSTDVQAMREAGLRFAAADTMTLDITPDALGSSEYDGTGSGSYLSGSLVSAVMGMPHGLSLSGLGALGVDVIDINGSLTSGSLHIDSADVQAVREAGLRFAEADKVTLDTTAEDLGSADYTGTGSGSYLSGSLESAVMGMPHGLSLSGLGALGVDVIDIGGSAFHAALHIDSADAQKMSDAGVGFAAADAITLDGLTDGLGVAAYDGNGAGSYLSVSLNSAFSAGGLNLNALGALGVDVIDLNGSLNNAVLHIDSADVLAMGEAGLGFATNDTITLDLALESGAYEGSGNGSHFASSLGAEDTLGGLSLSHLVGLGVDVVDVVGKKGTPGDYTAHISVTEASIAFNAGLVFDSQDDIVLNVTSEDSISGSTATVLAGVMNLNMQTGFGLDAVQFADGAAIALSGDQGLMNLLMGLTSSDTGVYSANQGVVLDQGADITVSDSMVKALLDAGIFTADAASTIRVDATSDTDGHVMTTLAQLADVGADEVEVAGDAAYIDLGNVADAAELNAVLNSLIDNQTQAFVTDSNGNAVSTGLLLTSAQEAALASIIGSNTAELSNMGIDKVYVADLDGTDLTLGLEHFRELQFNAT